MGRLAPEKKAKQLLKYFKDMKTDYTYMKKVFQSLRSELGISAPKGTTFSKLPYVPTEDEIKRYYEAVWNSKNLQDMMIIKTFLYTGVRVTELINIQIAEVDLNNCQIRITQGKGSKDRIVPFPVTFKELLAFHIDKMKDRGANYLFESSWKRQYTDRGIRKMLEKYSIASGSSQSISPHKMRHFLFTWLKKQGIDDALIQPFSGHESRKSLEIYSRLSITDAQGEYNKTMPTYPI